MDYSVLSPLGVHYIFLFWASLFFIAQFFSDLLLRTNTTI